MKIAGTYLSEKFLDHPDEEVCTAVNNKVQEYMEAMTGLCREEASLIMCRSLTGMFKVIKLIIGDFFMKQSLHAGWTGLLETQSFFRPDFFLNPAHPFSSCSFNFVIFV